MWCKVNKKSKFTSLVFEKSCFLRLFFTYFASRNQRMAVANRGSAEECDQNPAKFSKT